MKNPYTEESVPQGIVHLDKDRFRYRGEISDFPERTLIGKERVLTYQCSLTYSHTSLLFKVLDIEEEMFSEPHTYSGLGIFFGDDNVDREIEYTLKPITIKQIAYSLCGEMEPEINWTTKGLTRWDDKNRTLHLSIDDGLLYPPHLGMNCTIAPHEYGQILEEYPSGYGAYVLGGITLTVFTDNGEQFKDVVDRCLIPTFVVETILPSGATHTIVYKNGERLEVCAQFHKTPESIKEQYDQFALSQQRLKSAYDEKPQVKAAKTVKNKMETKLRTFAQCIQEAEKNPKGQKIILRAMDLYNDKYGDLPSEATAYRWKADAEKRGILKAE